MYDNIDLLESEFEIYKTFQKKTIIDSIKNEINILKFLQFEPSPNVDKETLFSIFFLIKIYSNLIENVSKEYRFNINWKDLFYFSLMESPSPESLIKNTIKEIKRKRSYNLTRYLNNIKNQKKKESFSIINLHKSKQIKLDKFLL